MSSPYWLSQDTHRVPTPIPARERRWGSSRLIYDSSPSRSNDNRLIICRNVWCDHSVPSAEWLFQQMCAGDNDQDLRLQERVADRLYNKNFLDDDNEFTESCSFDRVRDVIVNCAVVPGRDNEFLDELKISHLRSARPTDAAESLTKIAKYLGKMVESQPTTQLDRIPLGIFLGFSSDLVQSFQLPVP